MMLLDRAETEALFELQAINAVGATESAEVATRASVRIIVEDLHRTLFPGKHPDYQHPHYATLPGGKPADAAAIQTAMNTIDELWTALNAGGWVEPSTTVQARREGR